MTTTKIATCCYCGARAALVMDTDRHCLTCSSCGAPLQDLKTLPRTVLQPEKHQDPQPRRKGKTRHKPKAPTYKDRDRYREKPSKAYNYKRRKKRKSLGRKVFEELFDVLEDILD